MKQIENKEREFLLIIYGYLKGASFLKKTPSSLLIELKKRIIEREEYNAKTLERHKNYEDDSEYLYYYYNKCNDSKDELMEGYDDDKDPDQQNEDFWN